MGRAEMTGAVETGKSAGPFQALRGAIGPLDEDASAMLVAASADIALVLSSDGVIRHAAFSGEDVVPSDRKAWIGKSWSQIVTTESKPKVEQLLKEFPADGAIRWREITHKGAAGDDLPLRFSTMPLASSGRVLAIGRSLRAISVLQQRLIDIQRSMERDYARLRQTEARYRQLFQLAGEGVLIVEAASLKIVESNPAASALVDTPTSKLVGRMLSELFHEESKAPVERLLGAVRGGGRPDDIEIKLADHPGDYLRLAVSLFRQSGAAFFLVRLAAVKGEAIRLPTRSYAASVVERLPQAFVVTDQDRRILELNNAFLELTDLGSQEQARGQPLDRWLGRQSSDLNVIASNLREHGSVRDVLTVIRGEYGSSEPVEVTAVAVPTGELPCFGFVIEAATRRPGSNPFGGETLPRSTDQLVELVGRMPLKDIVRETADVIEKLCVQAALRATGDNRMSAAQMLGLSRQSLYAKLRRYGLADQDFSADS